MQYSFTALVLAFLALAPVSSQAVVSPDASLRLGLALYGNGAESAESQSRIAGTEIQASFSHEITPQLQARVAGGIQLETGAARLRWTQDFQPRQIQRLREAQIIWTPSGTWKLAAGALDQLQWESPLLLTRQSFPALYEGFKKSFGAFRLTVEAQQAVPADTSSLQPWGNWPKGMPGFYLERVTLRHTWREQTETFFSASHFLFENLSAPSAYQAQFLGNTIAGADASTTYLYGFQGFEFSAGVTSRIGKFTPSLRAALLKNGAAPSGRSTGYRAVLGTAWEASPFFTLTPELEFFRVESDAAPAFYNDRVFGHGNRDGFGAQITAAWPASGITASGRWVHSQVLSANPFQSSLDWIQVQMSAQYDLL